MVISKTYLSKYVADEIAIIPSRKAVRNTESNIKFVISFAIDTKKGIGFFINNMARNKKYTTYLY